MARSEARVLVSIWSDPDWLALTSTAQRAYLLLLSQPKLSLAGCLDWMPQRWERLCVDGGDVRAGIDELVGARFVVVDGDELVLRTFAVHDLRRCRNWKLVKGMWGAWSAIGSPVLRKVVVDHLPGHLWDLVEPPGEAVEMRSRSPIALPLGSATEPPTDCPIDRGFEPAFEPPIDSPVSFHLPPSTFQRCKSQDNRDSEPVDPQTLRRTAALVASTIADREATGSPAGLAASIRERILLGPDPTDRERIAAALVAGESPEVIAVGWLDGRNPATGADQPGPVGAAGSVVVEQSRPRLAPVVAAPVPSAEERAAGLALARSARSALSGPTPASGPMGPTAPGRPGGAAVGGNAGTLGSVHAVRVAGGAS